MALPPAENIANAVIASIKGGGELNDDAILSLHHVFQHNLLAALDIIDNHKVSRVTKQGREVFQVYGTEEVYFVYLNLMNMRDEVTGQTKSNDDLGLNWGVPAGWCSCPTFAVSVLITTENLLCKHLLAVLLSVKIGESPSRS